MFEVGSRIWQSDAKSHRILILLLKLEPHCCCCSRRWSWPPLNLFFAMLKKEWPSDRERLEWHKRLISNPFGSKMVPHCITTSAFTADNFGHRVQSIYLRIRQLKSTKHHTKNTKPKIFGFALFTPLFTFFFIPKCNISQSILKESLLKSLVTKANGFYESCSHSMHF